MKKPNQLNLLLLIIGFLLSFQSIAQLPNPAMVGYWENWTGSRYVDLIDIDDRYNVIQLSFANAKTGTDYDMEFNPPWTYTEEKFKSEIQSLQEQGKKVLISIGGQNGEHQLDSDLEKDVFISSINALIDKWGLDGLDIDLEGSSLDFNDVTITNPVDNIQRLIDAIKEIMNNHYQTHGKKMLLTMAPETYYVHGAFKSSSDKKGAYLPILEALKDSIDMLNVQLYNSGAMYGLDHRTYEQGTADWIVAMTEMVIQGFVAHGDIGTYSGLPASKVGVALPGCHSYDAVPHQDIIAGIKYLMGEGPQPGDYTLIEENGYPELRGMMTWSINSDKTCNPSYGFVNTWSKIFTNTPYIEIDNVAEIIEGNEDGGKIEVTLFNDEFNDELNSENWTLSNLPEGVSLGELIRVSPTSVQIVLQGNASEVYLSSITDVTVTISADELKGKLEDVSSNNGVTLKKAVHKIPGRIEAEAYVAIKNIRLKSDFEGTGDYFLQFWENDWAEYKIDVPSPNTYVIAFKVATSMDDDEEYSIKMTVNNDDDYDYKIVSETKYTNWEYYIYEIDLPKGEHTLKLDMSTGWCGLDYFEIYTANGLDNLKRNELYLFPNPASSQIKLDVPHDGEIFISAINGQNILHQTVSQGTIALNISEFSPGIYTVVYTELNGNIMRTKLIIK